jgi:hypothetical protein
LLSYITGSAYTVCMTAFLSPLRDFGGASLLALSATKFHDLRENCEAKRQGHRREMLHG